MVGHNKFPHFIKKGLRKKFYPVLRGAQKVLDLRFSYFVAPPPPPLPVIIDQSLNVNSSGENHGNPTGIPMQRVSSCSINGSKFCGVLHNVPSIIHGVLNTSFITSLI